MKVRSFHSDESGAATVGWLVLTAAIAGMAGSAVNSVRGGTASLVPEIAAKMAEAAPEGAQAATIPAMRPMPRVCAGLKGEERDACAAGRGSH